MAFQQPPVLPFPYSPTRENPVGFVITPPPPPEVVSSYAGNFYPAESQQAGNDWGSTTIPNRMFTYTPSSTIYESFTSSPTKYYTTSSYTEEPALARNAELIKGIKELQTKLKCMKEGADEFFQKPQAVIIYFEMMMESIFKGKV